MNLVTNARDAMPDGGTITIRIAAATVDAVEAAGNLYASPGSYVQLSVADTGCGMSPETAERIFEPFFSTKPVGQGTGLGLSTVFADVTKSDGFISVDSRQGRGTAFHVCLPAAKAAVAPPTADVDRSMSRSTGGDETILMCDDDETVLASYAFLLGGEGYSIISARGGREALEAAAAHGEAIALLLTDVVMPEMTGWDLARRLTQLNPNMHVIYMSGYASDILEAGAAEGRHIEFLQKPAGADTLFRCIRKALDSAKTCTS